MGVSYSTIVLSEPSLSPRNYAPVCKQTQLLTGGIALRGSPRVANAWEVTCLTDDPTEMDALEDLFGQRLPLNVEGVIYPNVMIAPPWREHQINEKYWTYTVNFIQEIPSP